MKEFVKSYTQPELRVNQPVELCNISGLFKAVLKGGYSFEYLNMAADCFPLKPASSNEQGFGD